MMMIAITAPRSSRAVRTGAMGTTGRDALRTVTGVSFAKLAQQFFLLDQLSLLGRNSRLRRLLELRELVFELLIGPAHVVRLLTGCLGVHHELFHQEPRRPLAVFVMLHEPVAHILLGQVGRRRRGLGKHGLEGRLGQFRARDGRRIGNGDVHEIVRLEVAAARWTSRVDVEMIVRAFYSW